MIQRFCFVKLLDNEVETRRELAQLMRAQLESEVDTDFAAGHLIDSGP